MKAERELAKLRMPLFEQYPGMWLDLTLTRLKAG